MRALLALLIALISVVPVAAMDSELLQHNTWISKKLNSLEIRLNNLETLHSDGRMRAYRKRYRTLWRLQKIVAKRFARLNGYKLSLSKRDLAANNQILTDAINSVMQETGSGIHGYISVIEGDCMPRLEGDQSDCSTTKLETELVVMPVTAVADKYVYYEFDQEPLARVESNKNGFYALALKPGTYSVFVDDEGSYYCNCFDLEGNACVVEIEAGRNLEYNVDIDHAFW